VCIAQAQKAPKARALPTALHPDRFHAQIGHITPVRAPERLPCTAEIAMLAVVPNQQHKRDIGEGKPHETSP
jgi:hypothetical protein